MYRCSATHPGHERAPSAAGKTQAECSQAGCNQDTTPSQFVERKAASRARLTHIAAGLGRGLGGRRYGLGFAGLHHVHALAAAPDPSTMLTLGAARVV